MTARLLERVFGHVASRPDQLAVVGPDRTLTWSALTAEVEALSEQLRAVETWGAEPLVAVPSRRLADYVVHALAVLRAGGAFVPFDLHAPPERTRNLAQRAGVQFSTVPQLSPLLATGAPVHATNEANGDPLAYGLFTSGTTGEPHLVGVPQSAVLAMLDAYEAVAPAAGGPVVSSSGCPFGFDVSVWELFTALASGGTAVVLERDDVRDPGRLVDRWQQHSITTAYCPPALLEAVADEAERRGGLGQLQRLLTGVEPIAQRTLGRFLDLAPGLAVVNGYGPTEATVCCTFHRFEAVEEPERRTPIGREAQGYSVRLVDPDREGAELVDVEAVGAVGEIVVGGAGLARGYLDDPALTAERFVWVDGKRWYRTGDLGRWLPGAVIEFVGRRDAQVKVRGFRVELGEVESALLSCPGVVGAVAIAEPAGPVGGGRRLAGFVVPGAGEVLSAEGVRSWLSGRVPDYVVPSRVVVVESLPLTVNGKVDRVALSVLARSRPVSGGFVAPPVGRASAVAGLWSEVLGVDRVGMTDSFFDLGGDSRSLATLVGRINDRFDIDLRVVDFMAAPTVQGITRWLDASTGGTAPLGADLGRQAAGRARARNRRKR